VTTDLPHGYRRITDDRIRENVGLGYDDLTPGLTIEHRPGRTITETDNILMSMLAANLAPIHTDAHYSSQTEWGRPLVCAGVTVNIVGGMTVRSISGLTIANLALDQVRFTHPVFVGDTLYAETQISSRRPSRSRPGTGIITCQTAATNQDHRPVVSLTRTFLIPIDPAAVRAKTDY